MKMNTSVDAESLRSAGCSKQDIGNLREGDLQMPRWPGSITDRGGF